jgi:hypothetical protein
MLLPKVESFVRKEGIIMPSQQLMKLLDLLKPEVEKVSYRKNIKIDTLVQKLKKESWSERDQ